MTNTIIKAHIIIIVWLPILLASFLDDTFVTIIKNSYTVITIVFNALYSVSRSSLEYFTFIHHSP